MFPIEYAQECTHHLNLLEPDIQFTTDGEDNVLEFLDTYTVRQEDHHHIFLKCQNAYTGTMEAHVKFRMLAVTEKFEKFEKFYLLAVTC